MTRKPHTRRPNAPSPSDTPVDSGPTPVDHPVFGQPRPTADPTQFRSDHPSDNPIYKQIDELNRQHKLAPLPFPEPRGLPEPRLTLAAVLGNDGAAAERQIAASGQIVFHSTGDTGNTRGPEAQSRVADKMVSDFSDNPPDSPSFSCILVTSSTALANRSTIMISFTNPTAIIRRQSWRSPATTMAWWRPIRVPQLSRHSWKISAPPVSR